MKDEKTQECLIQDVMFNQTQEEGAIIKVVETEAVWHGVTYKEDKEIVVSALREKLEKGIYPEKLW